MKELPFPPASRLVAYCRDSGGRDQDLSITQQETRIAQWCQAHGYTLARTYKDAARTGTTTAGRDQFLAMFAYLAGDNTRVAGLILWEYARLSRDWDDTMFYLADLRRQGYTVHSLNDDIPAGLEGRLMESIIAWKNARYSAELSRNVRRGKQFIITHHKAYPHGVPPLGYRKEPITIGLRRDGTPHQVSRLIPDPDTAPLVRQAFAMRAEGASLSEIRQALGIYNRNSSFPRFFDNQIYIGIYAYSGLHVEDYCPPLVDAATWQQVQLITQQSRQRVGLYHPRRISSPFLLSGLACCALCGSPLTGHHTKPKSHLGYYSYYICPHKSYRITAEDYCPAPTIRKEPLEELVHDRLLQLLDDPQLLQDIYADLRRRHAIGDQDRQRQERQARQDLLENQRRLDRLSLAIQEHGHSPTLLRDLQALEEKNAQLAQALFAIENSAPQPLPPVDIPTLAGEVRAALSVAQARSLQRLYRLLIDRLEVQSTPAGPTGQLHYTLGPLKSVLSL